MINFKEGECQFREGILCEEPKCKFCGWNPKVEKERRKKIRSELTIQYQLQLRQKARKK